MDSMNYPHDTQYPTVKVSDSQLSDLTVDEIDAINLDCARQEYIFAMRAMRNEQLAEVDNRWVDLFEGDN